MEEFEEKLNSIEKGEIYKKEDKLKQLRNVNGV